jgi:hypothetical protein
MFQSVARFTCIFTEANTCFLIFLACIILLCSFIGNNFNQERLEWLMINECVG